MKMIDVLHMPRSIWLGRKTEQNFRPIAFDVYKWLSDYPEATVSIVYTRPDGEVFPVASSDRSPIIWIPQQDVTAVSGEGEIELHLVGGGSVGISASTKTLIDDSAASAQPTAPSWVDQVVQDVTEQADRAEEAADSIGGAIDEAVAEAVPPAVADYIEEHPIEVTETDPTVPAWAKQPTKPTYTAQEVGALPSSYTPPVTSVNGMTGDVVVETGGGGAVDSVNGKTGAVVLDASDVGALPDSTVIPPAVTEQTVREWGFTKNTGTYSKPSGGIPASDLDQAVQTSLGKADTALQQHQSLAGYATETWVQNQGYQTAQDVQTAIAAIPDELPAVTATDNGKVLGVVNGAWAVKTDEGGSSVTVDDALSTTSTNPVQNKVVKAALDAKADASALAAKQDALTAGQNITISGNTISAYADSAEIAANVTDWLDDNVTPVGSAVVVDSSLSVSGAAADAAATGEIKTKLTIKESNNLSKSDSDWTSGYIVSNTNGNLVASSALSTSDYIPVNKGDVICLYDLSGGTFGNREMRAIATYDANKTAVSNPDSTGWRQYSYTVVDGIKYVRVSAPTASQYMITNNYAPTVFEPWFEPYYVATDAFIVDAINGVKTTDLKNGIAFALPQTIFRQTVGLSQTWYKKSMITPPSEFVYVRGGETGTTDFTDKVTFANASPKNSENGFIWYAYDPYFNLLKKYDAGTGYGSSAKVIAENLQDCTVLVIGDSTVDAGDMTGSMLSYFTSKGKTLTLLGTLSENGNPLNRNEGRAGWNTADYMKNSTNNGYTNPFYNSSTGTFDFSYYMAQQGYSGVDFVVIQLGINDLYPSAPKNTTEPDYAAIWANMAAMISSIKAYNNSIKVIINLPTTPNSDPTKHGICEFLYRHWVVRYNEYALAKIKDYGTASVRASYCHLILDPATDIRDNVHPTAAGYEKMALELINQINVWQDGA